MSRELVPLKVRIGLRPNGHAKYPNFNALPCVQIAGMDWAKYVDVHGLGWHYDKTSGHKEESADSPRGMQWGCLMVPEEFVDQAVNMFPEDCQELTEQEFEAFYDEKAHAHEPDEEIDQQMLDGIKMKQSLGLALTEQQQKAIDPNDYSVRGIRKNMRRKWKDYKTLVGVAAKQGRVITHRIS